MRYLFPIMTAVGCITFDHSHMFGLMLIAAGIVGWNAYLTDVIVKEEVKRNV